MSKSTISTFKLFELFPDNEAARLYLEARLWPNGTVCPDCKGSKNQQDQARRLLSLQRLQLRFHHPYRDDLRAFQDPAE